MPSARGLSGPTTVKSAFFSNANASSFGKSSAPMLRHWTTVWLLARLSFAIPAFPRAHHIARTCGHCARFHTIACSRPPEPMTNTFIERAIETGNEKTGNAEMNYDFGLAQRAGFRLSSGHEDYPS